MLPGPLLGWLGTLMFLLLMQFLIRYLPDLVGKGLPISVIVELVAYSLAYMLVLAVPMSVLISTLMTYGRLAESRAYAVIKSAGISLPQLMWPTLIVGLALAGGMWFFNSQVLPEANFRAKVLWSDIRQKKPGFELEPGVFYEGVKRFSIMVHGIDQATNELQEVTIFDYSRGNNERAEILAQSGQIIPFGDGSRIDIVLFDGEMHRLIRGPGPDERYERLAFERYRFSVTLDDFNFQRTDPAKGQRSDRTMRSNEMIVLVDSLRASVGRATSEIRQATMDLATSKADLVVPARTGDHIVEGHHRAVVLAGLDASQQSRVYTGAAQKARLARSEIDNRKRVITWQSRRADRYAVEIHKKYSIALACLIFMLVGAPLGLSIRRGGLGTAAGLAIAIFLFYWVTLVQGEKLADRGYLTPWVGMWIANIVTLAVGVGLTLYVTFDIAATRSVLKRHVVALWRKVR